MEDLSKSLSSLTKYVRYGEFLRPARDWFVLLSCAAVLFIGVVAWGIWAFDTVASGGTIGGVSEPAAPIFSQQSLDAIHAVFTDRAAENLKYETGAYRFADPSQ